MSRQYIVEALFIVATGVGVLLQNLHHLARCMTELGRFRHPAAYRVPPGAVVDFEQIPIRIAADIDRLSNGLTVPIPAHVGEIPRIGVGEALHPLVDLADRPSVTGVGHLFQLRNGGPGCHALDWICCHVANVLRPSDKNVDTGQRVEY